MQIKKSELLVIQDRKIEKVEVPEWNGHLYVRNMNALERDEYDRWLIGADGIPDMTGMRLKLVIMTACDENGARMFTREDYETLAQRDGSAVTRIFMASRLVNGMDRKSADAVIQRLKNARPASLPSS